MTHRLNEKGKNSAEAEYVPESEESAEDDWRCEVLASSPMEGEKVASIHQSNEHG